MILTYLSKNTSEFGKIAIYVQGLLTKAKRKTCVQMASSLLIPHDFLQKILGKNVQLFFLRGRMEKSYNSY